MTRIHRRSHSSRQPLKVRLSPYGMLRRCAVLSGMGLTVVAGGVFPAVALAGGAPFGSPAWFAQPHGDPASAGSTPPSSGVPGSVGTPQQVLQNAQMQRSMADLSTAAQAITGMQQYQSAQHQLALGSSCTSGVNCVMDGVTDPDHPLQPGYLPGLQADDPAQWVGVATNSSGEPYTETVANGQTDVTITQTQQKAILTWTTFNVGKNTTVDFDQSQGTQTDGSNNWIALNRIDETASPTQILGTIKADGTVYLIDPNGIIFGGSSQVNVHSLIASSLALFSSDIATSNSDFLTGGVGQVNGALLVQPTDSNGLAYTPGAIAVEAGASISTGRLGYSLIAAPSVSNAGTIVATDGEAALVAGLEVDTSPTSVVVDLPLYISSSSSDPTMAPAVINTGLIQSHRGNITLLGTEVTQGTGGVLEATTGISSAGSVTILAGDGVDPGAPPLRSGAAVFSAGSVTAILPEEDGQTTTSGAAAAAAFSQVMAGGGISVTGGSVTFQRGSLVEAPGASVAVNAVQTQLSAIPDSPDIASYGRIYLDDGATIDVAGLVADSPYTSLTEPMSANLVTIAHVGGNELADSPLQRDGILEGASVTVDSRDSGTRSDGLQWVGSPVIDASGYVQQVPQTIDQLLVNGGSIALTGQEVITHSGSMLNLAGGYVHYLGGSVATTRLVAADGQVYDMAQADPNVDYVGFAGQYSEKHARWNVTSTYINPLISQSSEYESDYIQGGNAGRLSIALSAPDRFSPNLTQSAILDGSIDAGAIAGRHQVESGSMPEGGTFSISAAPSGDGNNGSAVSFVIQDHAADLDQIINSGCTTDCAVFVANSPLPGQNQQDATDVSSVSYWTAIPAVDLASAGFSNISIDGRAGLSGSPDGQIVVNSALSVQPGGSIDLIAAKLAIDANLTATAGTISVTGTGQTLQPQTTPSTPTAAITYTAGDHGDIVIGDNVVISTRGEWVNDAGLDPDQETGGAYINGGSITLKTDTNVVTVGGQSVETTGSIVFGTDSLLDVSSGGRVLPSGVLAMSNGVPLGQGGNISLITYGAPPTSSTSVLASGQTLSSGHIETVDGSALQDHLLAFGFSGGGDLTLQAIGFQIGGDACTTGSCDALYLPTDFFSNQGFHAYTLRSEVGSSIDGSVDLTGANFLPIYSTLLNAPTGSNLYATNSQSPNGVFASIGSLDAYQRTPTSFSLAAGLAFSNDANGAGIIATSYAGDVFNYFASQDGTLSIGSASDPATQPTTIQADPGATIELGSKYQLTLLGQIIDHGGNVVLTGDTDANLEQQGYSSLLLQNNAKLDPYTHTDPVSGDALGSIWLGAQSLIDVSGIAVENPLQAAVVSNGQRFTPATGKVLNGGNVVISDDSGYVIAEQGAKINASGTVTDDFYVAAAGSSGNPGALQYVRRPLWSNGGSITIGASSGLLFDGTITAAAGAPQGEGGSLTLSALNEAIANPQGGGMGLPGMILQQSGSFVPAGLTPGEDPIAASDSSIKANTLYFAADELTGSGITSLTVGSRSDLQSSVNFPPVVIGLVGGLDLDLGRSFVADAGDYVYVPAAGTPPGTSTGAAGPTPADASGCGGATTVCITAPYVQLAGYYDFAQTQGNAFAPFSTAPAPTDTVLNINATALLDIGGTFQLQDFGQTNFTSNAGKGDIRFYTPAEHDYPGVTTPLPGVLFSNGDLLFDAGQLYPATANTFIVEAYGADSTVKIESSGASTTPLSAGGSLLIDAVNIVQDGTLRAPSGSIVLGVGNTADTATQQLFDSCPPAAVQCTPMPLVATALVELGAGSLTSVSLDGLTVPYGTTVDGQNWNYNGDPLAGSAVANLNAPPSKLISINGASVDVDAQSNGIPQAVIDVSGGGQLVAQEWVPGTGGSRNVLQQYATTYTTGANDSAVAVPVPQYQDGRAIYAIVPGYQSVAAPYDPLMYQGQGSLAIGQSVQLSGIAGLPAGTYTLLPAQYATLPGAYRVVVEANSIDAVSTQNAVLADGTFLVAGNFVDDLTGATTARSVAFLVQSGPVWQQYSQFTLTQADSFFAAQAEHDGTVTPLLPMDAGQLVLAASASLALNGKLDSTAVDGGAGASVDIASQNIYITGSSESVPSGDVGYVQLSAQELDSLGASSLLIGGIRTRTADGDQINVLASNVVVDNGGSSADALKGPEIILVATGEGDASPLSGISVTAGSVIEAQGTIAAAKDVAITIGQNPSSAGASDGVSGDGALLRVSNGVAVAINRNDLSDSSESGTSPVLLNIASGATIGGADNAAVTLDSSASTVVGPGATIAAKAVDADSSAITFTSQDGVTAPGLVIGPELLASFANAQQLTLRSGSTIDFVGGGSAVDIDLASTNLTLSAGTFRSDGSSVSVTAATLGIDNELGAATNSPALSTTAGPLTLNAGEIDFGPGNASFAGFGTINATATAGVVGKGSGSIDFGAAAVTLTTPVIIAGQASNTMLKTTGDFTVSDLANATPLAISPLGGSITLQGGSSLTVDAPIQALAGTITLEAISGDLQLNGNADISVHGVAVPFFDVTEYAPAGTINLIADAGNIVVASGATLDFSADANGGDAGSLSVSALGQGQTAEIDGILKGAASAGYVGGSFGIDVGGAVDLDALAALLAQGGVDDSIAVHSRDGNLVLASGSTLTAASVSLVADGGNGGVDADAGNVIVDGDINVAGASGGTIALFGKSGVDVEGALSATTTAAGGRGGTITLGTSGVGDGTLDATYGYENVSAANSGSITIGSDATIAFAGGSGGTLYLRAPLLEADANGQHDVNVDLASQAQITGASTVTLEAYATWSTSDASTDASKHFDGLIDPAGIYNSDGTLVPGEFVDSTWAVVTNGNLQNDYFIPDAVNAAHTGFYQQTLMGFVQAPDLSSRFQQSVQQNASLQNVTLETTPGIDLVNPAGNITVASNWNLGALNSSGGYAYRYQGSIAPVLTLRAAGDIDVNASISDGFTQTNNPYALTQALDPAFLNNSAAPLPTWQNPLPLLTANLDGAVDANGMEITLQSSSYRFAAGADTTSSDPLALAAAAQADQTGNIVLGSHTTAVQNKFSAYAPTMIRTGTGSIQMAAAGDLLLQDTVAPGVIYTAGQRSDGITSTQALILTNKLLAQNNGVGGFKYIDDNYIVTGPVNPVRGGDVSIAVGGNIQGVENYENLWWPWMQLSYQTDSSGNEQSSAINFGGFDQGVMSVGGNVNIAAGHDISDLSVSLPTTWNLATSGSAPIGGGDLMVSAGNDILSGSYFVSNGSASISAGGQIGSDLSQSELDINENPFTVPLSTLFALQFGQMQVTARQSIDIGGLLNPSYDQSYLAAYGLLEYPRVDSQSYGSNSSFSALSTTGDIAFDTLPDSLSYQTEGNVVPDILPATLQLTALNGGISIDKPAELYPSPTGELSLIAANSIVFSTPVQLQYGAQTNSTSFGLIDAPASVLPSPESPVGSASVELTDFLLPGFPTEYYQVHSPDPLHADDATPVYVYSLDGSIDDGTTTDGFPSDVLNLIVDKPASIHAGLDIVNLSFIGQNLYTSDVTSIVAGRDIYDTPYPADPDLQQPMLLQLGGGGTFYIDAGRDLGPLTSASQQYQNNLQYGLPGAGILTTGNFFNPYLPHSGANIVALFGTAPGIDLHDFEDQYIDPSSSVAGSPGYGSQLVQFVEQYNQDCEQRGGQCGASSGLTVADAWTEFSNNSQMPLYEQQQFVYSVYFDILNQTGLDYNNPKSAYYQQYARGYAAINRLFPASYGYTANNLGVGANGAEMPVATGNLDMRGSTIQTQQGGSISILGPGGSVLVGSAAAVPFVVTNYDTGATQQISPNLQGILTLEQGDIDVFTDASVLLAQSRIFTEQGGDVLMWSSNGDINAGKGARTSSELPPPQYLCDFDHYCVVDAKGEVSGAGIATLQTVPDAPAGSVNLIAPRGTVDAGEAGIRVSGNVNIAALHVANADNIQVQGQTSGVPTGAVDSGALGAASAAAAAANQSAETMANTQAPDSAATVITVEVLGYGAPTEEEKKRMRKNGT